MSNKRPVFYISDRTGITAELLGHGLLTQFSAVEFEQSILPFVDSIEKAKNAVEKIDQAAQQYDCRPLLFSTIIDTKIRAVIAHSEGILFDFFNTFINPLESELNTKAKSVLGRSHGMGAYSSYKARIDAVNYALSNDDGASIDNYKMADIILIGVSRTGKTPTCLYLALQYHIMAANYPLTEEDLDSSQLPPSLDPYLDKLFGLTIDPMRLHQIRQERKSNSRYSSLQQCELEVEITEKMYHRQRIPFLDTSSVSIEEIATTMMQKTGLKRHLYR